MIRLSQKRILYLILLILAIILVAVFRQTTVDRVIFPKSFQRKYQFRVNFTNAMNEYRRCLLDQLRPRRDIFNLLRMAVDRCKDNESWASFGIKDFHNGEEPKLIVLPKQPGQPCVEVTLGVGRNIETERQIKKALPGCRFFGADPILASGQEFREVGQYFEIAIGSNTGVQIQNVLEDDGYRKRNVTTVDFADFLTQYVRTNFVDFLLMDNEGAEYGIFAKYLIDSPPIRICQMNAEMHGPLERYNMSAAKFDELMIATLSRSSFLPLSSTMGSGHARTFFMNVKDKECIEKYFQHN